MEGEDNTTTAAPGTPTPETYFDEDTDVVEPETTLDPDMGFSTETSPHGEYSFVNSIRLVVDDYLCRPSSLHLFVLNKMAG